MASRQYNPRRQAPQRGTKKRRSGASPSRASNPVPGWLWLVAGLGIGILVTSLWKLTDTDTAAASPREERAARQATARAQQQPRPAAAEKPAEKPAETSGTRFDFYTLLPEREVLVPNEREVNTAPAPATARSAAAAPARTANTPAPAPSTPAAAEPVYLLQAGSFRAYAEAERRRAQILLLGLEARVETVNANGDTWYRVHAGPFRSGDKLSQARALLSGEGIETLLLKQKPAG